MATSDTKYQPLVKEKSLHFIPLHLRSKVQLCFSIMASGFGFEFNSLNNSDFPTYSRAGNSVNLNDDGLQHGNVPSDETIGNTEPRQMFHGPFGSEHSMFQGLYSQFHQPFVHTQHGSPGIVPMVNQAENSDAYHLNRCECNTNPMSHRCIFLAKEPFQTEDSRVLSYQSSEHRSNYYQATFPTAIQMPYAIPSTNGDIFQESQNFFQNKYDAIEVPCSTNEPSRNETNIDQDLHPSTSQWLGSQNCRLQYSGSDAIQDTYMQSRNFPGRDFLSSSNINHPSFVVESSSSMLPGYESSGSHHSNPVASLLSESASDITIIKNLHPSSNSDFTPKRNLYPSSYRQSANLHVKTDGLYSPKKSISNHFFTSQVLNPLTHLPVQSEDSDIHQLNPVSRQLPPNDYNAHRVMEFPADKNEASIVRSVPSSNQQPRNNSRKNQVTDLQSENLYRKKHRKGKKSKNDSAEIRISNLDARAPKNDRLNYFSDKYSPDRFITMHELLKRFQDLSKIYPRFYLNNIKEVNIFIFGLDGCETIRLVVTLARNSYAEILNTFGLAFQKSINIPDMPLTLKCWNLQNCYRSANIRNRTKSTRNAIILVYDVTRKIDVYAILPEIEFLKLTNMPILLVGDTSNAITENSQESIGSKERLVLYEDGRLMKDLYNLSTFFEFSIDSEADVNGLFITAIDLAFRHEMKIFV